MTSSEHHHGHVHLGEADWEALADQTELEGEVLLAFVTDAAAWISEVRGVAPPVRRIVDIGSGPGVGSCELARCFPGAHVVAVDGSPAMLERVRQRVRSHGLDGRVEGHRAELPEGLGDLEPADVIWASMSLHHVGDEVGALRALRGVLAADGLLAIAEFGDRMAVLPAEVGVGRSGFVDRLQRAGAEWFSAMRQGLPGAVPSAELASMLTTAGYEVVGERLARVRLDAPLAPDARRMVHGHLLRLGRQLEGRLDGDDLDTLRVLTDPGDPRGVLQRPDVFVETSRQIVVARPAGSESSGGG